jgi:ubiquinone/menaquinone biosynthesis C-methylase UbiE
MWSIELGVESSEAAMVEFSNPEGYELWMGRWSTRLAPAFVGFAGLPKGGHFLDVGSGTGVLAAALLEGVEDCTVIGIDPAESYVAYSRERIHNERLRFEQGDALAIPFEDGSFDGTLALLILQELPDAPKAVQEMRRVTRVGGYVATNQWSFEYGMPMLSLFWDAVIEVVATDAAREAATNCMVVDYPDEDALRHLWEAAGLVEVETQRHEVDMTFASFEDYWTPFLTDVSSASSYTGKLRVDQVGDIKSHLRQTVTGVAPDRPFSLQAHAWAVRGKVPSL